MSYSEFTKELLDILDLNLTFHENAFRKERINDETCFVFDGTLTYRP
ncbi:ISL3 family transposase, partial [Enterococcus raffinosus]